jgi:uncharacterized membrane protein YhaH (DUF805 family)
MEGPSPQTVPTQPDRNRFWPFQLFRGRINRTEFIIGLIIASLIFCVSEYISLDIQLVEYLLRGIAIFFGLSLITRRVSDAGLYKEKAFEKSTLFYSIRYYALLFWIYLFKEGENRTNEDGPPPKEFSGSLRNLFALE